MADEAELLSREFNRLDKETLKFLDFVEDYRLTALARKRDRKAKFLSLEEAKKRFASQ
ncbi:MAG: hypothetical protein ABH845_05510 [Candidatus Omnitrophota bacterium]